MTLNTWKGRTFGQITSSIQKNENSAAKMEGRLLFMPPPLKIYRRELVTAPLKSQSSKLSTSIDVINQPGSYLVVSNDDDCECKGTIQTLDPLIPNNRTDTYACCNPNAMLDPATVARRRVRSSGVMKHTPPSTVTTAPYCTTSKEYLSTRGKTFGQNQFHYMKEGNPLVKPGAPGSENNKYALNNDGNVYCPKNPSFYVETQFKPTNYKYSQDGGVSSSARTSRLNYNTITTNGGLYTKAYGAEVGAALSYGASSDAYTIKDKIGVPAPCDTRCLIKKYS
jgi:hypothetical protein|tara:strand:+ start:242 stop:1084 length:843 start_codon:yes stop_codon:yes gene_type:complete